MEEILGTVKSEWDTWFGGLMKKRGRLLCGWTEPTMIDERKKEVIKPLEQWTTKEKNAYRFNSKSISTIFSAIDIDQFKIIQGCESAKAARDTLVNYFEGDTSVKWTHIDHLETLQSFTTKLNTIANEATMLGERYSKKKLVKKLIRYLPKRFKDTKIL